jgi:CRISPR system Cascade subunit CasA
VLDLLREPLLGVDGRQRLTLAQVFAQMSSARNLVFDRLRPHQQAPWHAFLVQLAYHALDVAGLQDPPTDEASWRELLAALTDDGSAWHLVVDDMAKPAFLQAAVPVSDHQAFNKVETSVQAVDLLTTSKNFDEKAQKIDPIRHRDTDCLVYALVTVQGWAPFQGAGNYSSMRMNGGFSSRPQFRLVQDRGTAAEWRRDLLALLAQREKFIEPREPGDIGSGRALRLLWLEPWGDQPLGLPDVHPLALEVCRRLRVITTPDERLLMRRASSKSMRVDAKAMQGVVRDPWVPLVLGDDGPRALTARHDSLGYKKLSSLLFDRQACTLPLLALPAPCDAPDRDNVLVAQILVGESGGSDGLISREVLLPRRGMALFQQGDARLGLRSRMQLEAAATAWGKVLRSALIQYLDGSDDVNWKHSDFGRMAEPWARRWDAEVDACFFQHLFDHLDAGDGEAAVAWAAELARRARPLFESAVRDMPTRCGSPRMATARANRLLRAGWQKNFGQELDAEMRKDALEANP